MTFPYSDDRQGRARTGGDDLVQLDRHAMRGKRSCAAAGEQVPGPQDPGAVLNWFDQN
ncbi:hypothetical protein [Roseinatronobacter sp. NSM]|uniref:hypothetical protein n=1 Tax=Roseinatronobacter sp. NSM TaxID=3457785 RepID=UPI00403667CB